MPRRLSDYEQLDSAPSPLGIGYAYDIAEPQPRSLSKLMDKTRSRFCRIRFKGEFNTTDEFPEGIFTIREIHYFEPVSTKR